uniref:Lon proteolytic domain-containing protein n=1 Tax=viral metagenome TaxID=1070528 RepID=A0A6C0D9W8_9ZZZZ
MQNNLYKFKLFKLYLLQNKYNELANIIFKLTSHINIIDSNYLIENNKKIVLITEIFNINKNINTIYNSYIINNIDKDPTNNVKPHIIDIINNTDESNFELLQNHFTDLPFNEEKKVLHKIISITGYSSLKELFSINNISINNMSSDFINIINELDNIFLPLSFKSFNLASNDNTEFYWRMPVKYSDEDILHLTREFWFKNKDNNYYKIEGIFKNDILSTILKTSQLTYPYLYTKKYNILKDISDDIDIGFVKKFIRYDYIGNIYCMTEIEYAKYLSNSFKLYLQLSKSTFINIMKNFISNSVNLYNLYFIILLLLLGNDDNAEVASLLINLTKEKKINSINLYNLINHNLSFYMQLKINKAAINIKADLEKLKAITIETIDYKKQLLSIKNIPNNIKVLTLEKIEEMKAQNNEFYKQKNFVDHIIKYPWPTNDQYFDVLNDDDKKRNFLIDLKNNLNNLTFGHEEAKNILSQTVANWISNPNSGGRPLGFVGPPGVGKTLLAKSISKALNIPFAEITLGGQNDGELLHGHGYTYSGSQPGLIIRKMVEMGKERCILYFDELDKSASKHGSTNEITSILIHLTDPNMNKSFQDRFFQGVDFPLDKVIMIFSYNDSNKIDPILLDRITEINIKPYTVSDKIVIIKDFVIPELKSNIGINHKWTNLDNKTIEYIIDNYTNEAGIRNIKRNIEKIFLALNYETLTQTVDPDKYILTIKEINRILLQPHSDITKIHHKPCVGIINGLYATTNGDGGIIPIQIYNNFTSTSFEIKLTGKQGDVMKESVQCALTCAIDYIKKNKLKYNIENIDEYFQQNFKNGFHVHAPATSTPKDGPSAGCAFTCAFISRILNRPIRNDISMTGEIELTGRITKIGGLNYKLFGAKKAGVKLIFIPKENKEDLDEIKIKNPKLLDKNFKVIIVEYLDEVIDHVLLI